MDIKARAQAAAAALDNGDHPIGCLRKVKPDSSSTKDTMTAWRAYRDATRRKVLSTYQILGFLSSGTYGRVYKARLRDGDPSASAPTSAQGSRSSTPAARLAAASVGDGAVFAIKKFKADSKDAEASTTYTGISQSAMREIALNRELRHENIVTLREVILEDRSIYMVFAYASHDFLQVIHHHSATLRTPIPGAVLKSLLFQLLSGVHYLHSNWVLHRDLKPANILLTSSGVVKIGDLGLARLYSQPLQPLYNGDKVVVTIWYRAPELLMGTRHYTPAIDMWAIGCIWGELLGLRPLFKGEEAKVDNKTKSSGSVLQTDQMARIIEVLGTPTPQRWPSIETMPDYRGYYQAMRLNADTHQSILYAYYTSRLRSQAGYTLLESLLQYDPAKRKTASEALEDEWFREDPIPTQNAFASLPNPAATYPQRKLHSDTTDPVMNVDPAQAAKEREVLQQRFEEWQQQHARDQQAQAEAAAAAAAAMAAAKGKSGVKPTQQQQQPPPPPQAAPLGPPAPAPAPVSVGSLPSTVGPNSNGPSGIVGGGTGTASGGTGVSTAAATAAAAASLGLPAGGGYGGLNNGANTNSNAAMLAAVGNLGLSGSGASANTIGNTAPPSSSSRGGMVATAAANAAANASREQANKRARMG